MKYITGILATFLLVTASAQQSYTLESFIAEMLQKDFGILLLKNEISIAENNNNIGAAGYLPTIGIAADKNWSDNNTRQEFFSGQVNQSASAKNSSTNAVARLDWIFFDGFRMFAVDKRLDAQESIATMNLTAEMEMKVYQASVLFFTLIQQQKLNAVYEQALDLSKARYDLVKLKVDNGAGTEIQLIQARLDLTADSSVYLNNRKTIEDLIADMNSFLAKDPATPLFVQGDLMTAASISWEQSSSAALAQNTNLLLAKANIAIRDLERKEARSYYYPQIGLYGQYAFAQQQNQIGILNSSRSYGTGVGFTLQWNILDRLTTYTALKNNKLQQESAEIYEQQQSLLIRTELRKTFNEYEWAQRNLQLEQQNITESEATFRIAQNAFENGSITNLELREIQFSIVQAQSRYLQAQLALKTAELNMSLTTGNFKSLLGQ
jgi:outer membrane protein